MSYAEQTRKIVHFGVFEVDLHSAELRKQGLRIRLPGQSFQVLESLLSRPGELVTREELQQKLWPSDSFGDFEHGLNAAVNRVREALGDSAENPRFVETLPRRGYRFIAPVDSASTNGHHLQKSAAPAIDPPAPQLASGPAIPSIGASAATAPLLRLGLRVLFAALILASLVCGALLFARLVQYLAKNASRRAQDDLRAVPLTTTPGFVVSPTFSPDGSQVAFASDAARTGPLEALDLYVKVVGAEHVERLTNKPTGFIVPAWSPDGRNIAFIRFAESESDRGIFIIPARGGPERKIADPPGPGMYTPALSWSPDARHLLYGTAGVLHSLTPETGANDTLPLQCKEAYAPAYSPDGSTIAFGCYTDDDVTKIYTTHPGGGPAKYVSEINTLSGPMAWTTDGSRILLPTEGDLWSISKDGGKPRHLPFAQGAFQLAMSPRGERLAFVRGNGRVNIWQVAIDPNDEPSRTVIAPSTRQQRAPDISPDGKRIVFESERSGFHEVWVANLDGSDAVQLTNFHRLSGTPRWSPDGHQIVFDSRESGEAALYLVDPDAAVPRRIPINGLPPSVPSWSRDGKWIYFRAGRARVGGLYKVPPQGGDPILVTPTLGYNVQESTDGKSLYFASKLFDAEILVKNAITGEQHPLAGMPLVINPTEWVVTSTGIFFINRNVNQPDIAFFDFASAKITRHIPIEKYPMGWGGLAISPDGKSLFYSQVDEASTELMLVEGFQ